MVEQEKEQARAEAREAALDMDKQADMGGFYRHLHADKEKFVTAAFLAKMKKMAEQEREQARGELLMKDSLHRRQDPPGAEVLPEVGGAGGHAKAEHDVSKSRQLGGPRED
jgi:hypothetical protein